jgi:PAS domain S-box-containing protein
MSLRVLYLAGSDERAAEITAAFGPLNFELLLTPHDVSDGPLERLRSTDADLILVDFRAVRRTGFRLLEGIRSRKPDFPILVLSWEEVTVDEAVECLKGGSADFILAPDAQRLRAAAGDALARSAERRREKQNFQETGERLRHVFDDAPIGMALTGKDYRFVRANRAFCTMVGYSEEELKNLTFGEITHPEDRGADEQHADRLFSGEIGAYKRRKRYIRKDGAVVWGDLTVAIVRSQADNSPAHALAMVENATTHKLLEDQLRQSQKMEAIGRLAGGVAHDFNNLLTAILGYAELMVNDTHEGDPLRASAESIREAAERAASLTRQLLSFSRKRAASTQILNINSVLAETEKMLRRLLGEDIEIIIRASPGLPMIKSDPGQISQILLNLAVNARDAMPRGGKLVIETLVAELESNFPAVHLGVQGGKYAVLVVSDTGVGMTGEVRSHLFEPFFTTKETGKGTGLGLSTVYGIVRQSGGNIWVYSEPGLGTTFKIYFPAVAGQALESAPDLPIPQKVAADGTILLVEDDEFILELARQVLSKDGYNVLPARTVEDAEKLCRANRVDLLLTDVVMPGLSGRAFSERLRKLQPGMKVLYMSGYTEEAMEHHGLLEPDTPLVQKPFAPRELSSRVHAALKRPQTNVRPRSGGSEFNPSAD